MTGRPAANQNDPESLDANLLKLDRLMSETEGKGPKIIRHKPRKRCWGFV